MHWYHVDHKDAPNDIPVVGVAYEEKRWRAGVFVYKTGYGYLAMSDEAERFDPTHWAHMSPEMVLMTENIR